MVLAFLLDKYGYSISNENLIDITLDVAGNNYEVEEIAQKLSQMIEVQI